MAADPSKQEVDKQLMYGQFQQGEDRRAKRREWKDRLQEKTAHKAVDIALDDEDEEPMHLERTVNSSGIGTGGAIGIAAIAGALGALPSVLGYLDDDKPAPAPPAPAVSTDGQARDFVIRHWIRDKDGNLVPVEIPHVSTIKGQQ